MSGKQAPSAPTLPGLEAPPVVVSTVEALCAEFIQDLDASGLMTPRRRMLGQVMQDMAKVIGVGAGTAKTSSALAVPQFLACLEAMQLPAEDTQGSGQIASLLEAMRAK